MKFIVLVKRNILSIIFCLFTLCLVIFSRESLIAAKSGLSLWANSVVPSLLPFFIATELLCQTNIIHILGRFLNFIMKPLFNVPGEGAFAFVMGIISGYPVGAKIATDLREKNIITKIEAERLLAFTNNSGPLFIIGTVGISMFGNTTIGFLLLITHILACLTVGIIFRFYKGDVLFYGKNATKGTASCQKGVPFMAKMLQNNTSPIGQILSSSISNAIQHVVTIGGFIVLFSVILSILEKTRILLFFSSFLYPIFNLLHINTSFASGFISGIIELTNGVNQICGIHIKEISTNIMFCAFLLGFSGISIIFQVLSIISKTDLSIKPYIYGKLLQGIFACLYVFLFINHFQIFNFNL